MIRRLFTIASALSFLLFIATAVLWVASRSRNICLTHVSWPRSYFGVQVVGGAAFAWWTVQPMTDSAPGWTLRLDLTDTPLWRQSHPSESAAQMERDMLYHEFTLLPLRTKFLWRVGSFAMMHVFMSDVGDGRPFRSINVAFPLWAVMAVAGFVPIVRAATWLPARRRARSLRLGLCSICGYYLRGSITRCPECGTPIPAEARA